MSYKNKRTFCVTVRTYVQPWSGFVRIGANLPTVGGPAWGQYAGFPSADNFITIPDAGNTFPPDPADGASYQLFNGDAMSMLLIAPVDCRLVGISMAMESDRQWYAGYSTVTGFRFGAVKTSLPGPGETAVDGEATTTWTVIGILETSPAWQIVDATPDHCLEYSVSLDSSDGDVERGECVGIVIQATGTVDSSYLKSGSHYGVLTLTFDID